MHVHQPEPWGRLASACNQNPEPYFVWSCSARESFDENWTISVQTKAALSKAPGACGCE